MIFYTIIMLCYDIWSVAKVFGKVVRMEGRRRGGRSGRRIVASRRGSSGNGDVNDNGINNNNNLSIIKKLQNREIRSKPHRAFASATAPHRFRAIRLTHEYDTHDPSKTSSSLLPFLMKRTKVVEIVAAKNVVFALYHSGLCAAYSRGEVVFKKNLDCWYFICELLLLIVVLLIFVGFV